MAVFVHLASLGLWLSTMRITVVGRGNVGGGLARLWQRAGHTVTALGSDGGDASGADVLVVAVPSTAIADALGTVGGIQGKVTVEPFSSSRLPRSPALPGSAGEVWCTTSIEVSELRP